MDDVKISNKEIMEVEAAPTTVPKKRGRPANPDKPKKQPSGRGRGRPAKISGTSSTMKQINVNISEDEDCSGSSPVANGSTEMNLPSRGRPPKSGKLKLRHSIEATGKGRGRPKKTFKSNLEDEDEDNDDDEEGELSDYKPSKKMVGKKSVKKGRGRPKKVKDTDDDSSDGKNYDEDERRTVGRPSSGGVNLNIERTGRGQGRPKKELYAKRSSEVSNGGSSDGVPKKRGRPSTTGKNPYTPTGKPRGRPKGTSIITDSQDEADLTAAKSENSEHSGDSHNPGINLSKYNSVPSAEEDEVHTDSDKEEND